MRTLVACIDWKLVVNLVKEIIMRTKDNFMLGLLMLVPLVWGLSIFTTSVVPKVVLIMIVSVLVCESFREAIVNERGK